MRFAKFVTNSTFPEYIPYCTKCIIQMRGGKKRKIGINLFPCGGGKGGMVLDNKKPRAVKVRTDKRS
jgi:hypothetical protein